MATPGNKIHKVTRTLTLAKTFDEDGNPVVVVLRRLRRTAMLTVYKNLTALPDEQAKDEAKEMLKTLTPAELAMRNEEYFAMADAVLCLASVEPRFYVDAPPPGGLPELWAPIEAVHDEDKEAMMQAVMEMAGLVGQGEREGEDAAAVASFPAADGGGGSDG